MTRAKTAFYDAVIIGAGAAGLSCGFELLKKKKSFAIFEAQARIGGRILTHSSKISNLPLELGPEFIHGYPTEIMKIAQEKALPYYEVTDLHYSFQKRKPARLVKEYWDILQDVLEKIPRNKDQSVAAFLKSHRFNSWTKSHFSSFVEGFHSADLNIMSSQGLLETEEVSEDERNGSELFRWKSGYEDFINKFASVAGAKIKSRIHLDTILKNIDWSQKKIRLRLQHSKSSRQIHIACHKLVLTVPVGVLKAPARSKAGIEWFPEPPQVLRRALEYIHMGSVEKINFTFKSRFWEKLTDKQPAFFHTTPDHFFPTWWTQMPIRSPHLVAWQGGPKAESMKNWKTDDKITAALKTLSILSRKTIMSLRSELVEYHTHNWNCDPFTLGAYTYIGVNGVEAAKRLNQVLEDRIIIAGEGSVTGSGRGTVHGAMASGLRAARQILTMN